MLLIILFSQEQYQYIYDAVQEHLDSSYTYENYVVNESYENNYEDKLL